MIRPENLIVEGRCFVQIGIETKNIMGIKNALTEFMNLKGYEPEDPRTIFFQDRFLTMTFNLMLPFRTIPLGLRIKKSLGLISKDELDWQMYSKSLSRTRGDVPFKVTFSIVPSKLADKEGLAINIRSEPVILFKMTNLGMRPRLDEFDYSQITDNNKQFVSEIMAGIGAKVLERPKAIAEYTKTPILEKLAKFGFDTIAELLRQGKMKIETGNTEDGLTDLREALVNFVSEAVRRRGGEPKKSIPTDLDTLENSGYIDKRMHEVIHNFLYNWIYKYLSAKPVHGRERISFDDAKFLFSVSEEIMSYLLEKIMLGR